jgi:hypothetical protein
MASETGTRWQLVMLVLLIVTLAAVVVYNLGGSKPAAPAAASSKPEGRRAARSGGAAATTGQDLDVRLDALNAPKAQPEDVDRNPFRFRPKPPPPAPPSPKITGPPGALSGESAPPVPSGPLPPPAIPLKFIGVIESPRVGKVAALSDTKGAVFHGREGQVVEGRYRIVRIGVESIVMEYVDGQGRQTIRMSGS